MRSTTSSPRGPGFEARLRNNVFPLRLALVSSAKTAPSRPSWWRAFRPEQVGKTGLSLSAAFFSRAGPAQPAVFVTSAARRFVLLILESNTMEQPTKEQIIHRAYQLWEQAGKPEGRDEEFYHLAEQELRNADKSSPLRTPDNL
jgi:hypothetical protein